MKKNAKHNELQSRREFFKKAAKGVLPMLGAFVAGPTVIMSTLISCGPDDCDGCEAACRDNCSDSCKGDCYTSCSSSSAGGDCSDCSSSCSASSTNSTCSSCANDCSSSCKDTCQENCSDGCKTTCSSSCEGSATGKPTTGSINGHEYVDLGLSVLWATCNIGASNPKESGTYFHFGDPDGCITEISMDIYNHFKSIGHDICICGTEYDAARKQWGNMWRLPTKNEVEELRKMTTFEVVDNDAGYCAKLKSKINNKEILIPIAGYYAGRRDAEIMYGKQRGLCWTGDVSKTFDWRTGAYVIHCYHNYGYDSGIDNPWVASMSTYFFNIRPVIERNNQNISTCNASCTANCSDDCVSTCKNNCSETCYGNCGGNCSGNCKESCSTGCQTTCKGECKEKCTKTCADSCSNDCTGKCTKTCADSCKAQTSQYCSNCANYCSSGCTTNCADACKAQTSQGCSNCSSECSGKCGGSCQSDCTGSCGMNCAVTCGGSCSADCIGRCQSYCTNSSYNNTSWCAGCVFNCSSYCANTCSFYCYSSCKNNGRIG